MTALVVILAAGLLLAVAFGWSQRRHLRAANARHAQVLAQAQTRQQASLEAERQRVFAIFDRMIDGVLILDATGRIGFANRAAAMFFEASTAMAGRTLLEATRRHEIAGILTQLAQHPEVLDQEVSLERLGEPRTVLVNALALTATSGAREGALLVFHDVTRLRQLESVRQDFVANVSHELRTPLSLIKSAAETLIDGPKTDPVVVARFLEIVDKNADRLTLLIDDLLLLARLDSGRLELQVQPLSLREAADSALDDAALIARSRGIVLRNEIPSALMGLADPDRLRQVLANLIDNAIRYGRLQGSVVVIGRSYDSRLLEIGVQDNGPGIPPESKARIFERFYRVDKARAREQGGTGLGLAIVKNVVEAHGGTVRVESAAGEGTTFFFTLPVAAESTRR